MIKAYWAEDGENGRKEKFDGSSWLVKDLVDESRLNTTLFFFWAEPPEVNRFWEELVLRDLVAFVYCMVRISLALLFFTVNRSSGTIGILFSLLKENSSGPSICCFAGRIFLYTGFFGGRPTAEALGPKPPILVYLSPVAVWTFLSPMSLRGMNLCKDWLLVGGSYRVLPLSWTF